MILLVGAIVQAGVTTCPVKGEGHTVEWAEYHDEAKTQPKGRWSSLAVRALYFMFVLKLPSSL